MFQTRLRFLILVLLAALLPAATSLALTNNVALTPPMGWNDWNSYGSGITEADITNTASTMAGNGMKAAGYQFISIDDRALSSRDTNGVLLANPATFPDGIKWVANYTHSLGLKQGVYADHGTNTCSGYNSPGSYDYEYLDAFTFASWGADYLKEDNCKVPANDNAFADYSRMSDGLVKSGRPIVFCICGNGLNTQTKGYESWSPTLGNQWRTTSDIKNTFASMISHIDQNSTTAFVAGPGRWNDPDMLEIGNGEFATNYVAAQTHFTMWCIMAAPLIAGNNLTTMSAQTLAILTNSEAIAVDQDPAGEQGERVDGIVDSAEVWSKPLGYDFTTRAVALLNRSTTSPAAITCYFTNLAFPAGSSATVRDLLAHQDLGTFTNSFTATVTNYGSMLLKIVGTPLPAPGLGTNYLSDRQPVYAYTGSGTIVKDKSIGGNTIKLGGVTYPKGIGVNSYSGVEYDLGGVASSFQATIGVDDEVDASGTVIFQVFADGTKIYDSGVMTGSSPSQVLNLDMTGVRRLVLGVDEADDGNSDDHADWADALVVVTNATPQPPHAPTGLAASPGNSITLTWNTTLAAVTYNVKRATNSGGTYTTLTNVPVTTFTDGNVVSGTNYYYVVSAVNNIGESSNSLEAAVTPCNVPAAPTNVTAAAVSSQVVVRWNASAGATGYNLSRFTGTTPPTIVASGITATNFTDTTVTNGATYYYIVNAANSCNQGGNSLFAAVILPPATPTGLAALSGSGQVNLSWSASSGATGYNVKRSTTNGGPYAVIASGTAGTGYLDTAVINGTTYYYVVSASDMAGESANSTQVSAAPVAPLTACWTNTVTAAAQSWNVNANWTNVAAFPNGIGALAIIGANIAAPQTINLNQPVTVGALQIGDADGSASYTIAASGGSLTFAATNIASLTQVASSRGDVLATPVSITTNLVIINNSANPLTLAGNLSSSSGALIIGSGTLQVGDGTTNGSLGPVNVTNNAALVFNRSDSVTNSGAISGSGSVAQNGTGVLTLGGANNFSGGVTIQNGTLQAGNAAALGSAGGITVITNGGTLDVNALNLTGEPVTVSGSGVGGNGAIVNSGGQQTSALRTVTLAGDTVFGGAGRWDIRNTGGTASLSSGGRPWNLSKAGTNQVSFVAVSVDANLGNIDICGGEMGFEQGTTSMGNPASNLTVEAGALLEFYQSSGVNNWTKQFVLNGNGVTPVVTNTTGGTTLNGNMTLNGNCIIAVGGSGLTNNCVIGGAGGLTKILGSPLVLTANETYTGATAVGAGTLALAGNGSISASAAITVASGATLDASQRSDVTLTLAAGQTLTGNGAVKGNVVVGSGATLAPGGSISTLAFSNNLTLNGGSVTVMEINKSAPGSNDVALVTSNLFYGGTLVITNIGTAPFAAGDNFKLFNAAAYSGAFTNLVPAIPAVNLAWSTNNLGSGILSVVSSPTAQPKFGAMTANGGNFVFSGSNGVRNWTYYLLASTNAALPLTNWTMVSTNSFDAAGSFNVTNPLDLNAPQTFFLLKLQ